VILLAEHDEPSLAAKKKQRHVALKTATSTPKNRVWNFFGSALGRISCEPASTPETATGSVQFSYETASGQAYYYTRDHLGSTRELCNSSGSIVARYSYDPYGRATLVSGTNLATKQYAGEYAHQPSGLNLTQYRVYDPNTGRWYSRDPLEDAERMEGPNLYAYVQDDPINLTDPFGLYSCSEICGLIPKIQAGIKALQQIAQSGKYSPKAHGEADVYSGGQTQLETDLEHSPESYANAAGEIACVGVGSSMAGAANAMGIQGFGDFWTYWADAEIARNQMFIRMLQDLAKKQGCKCCGTPLPAASNDNIKPIA
jgi:RHS repeat-associated protein